MKTINCMIDIDNNKIVNMNLKKKFEHRGFNFAIVIEPEANHKYYTLINFENGGVLPMYQPTNQTIKDYHTKSLESIDNLIKRIGLDEFTAVLNKYPKIN